MHDIPHSSSFLNKEFLFSYLNALICLCFIFYIDDKCKIVSLIIYCFLFRIFCRCQQQLVNIPLPLTGFANGSVLVLTNVASKANKLGTKHFLFTFQNRSVLVLTNVPSYVCKNSWIFLSLSLTFPPLFEQKLVTCISSASKDHVQTLLQIGK